jgi:hypothetical protein
MSTSAAKPQTVQPPGCQEELDLWWGSYSGRAMVPSFVVCLGLTVVLYVCTSWWVPQRGWLQLTFTVFAGLLWLIQFGRWAHRCFTYNYRLTSRYLYVDRGFWPLVARRFALTAIGRVECKARPLDGWLRIGDVQVWLANEANAPVVLRALLSPRSAAETIRSAVKKAGEC